MKEYEQVIMKRVLTEKQLMIGKWKQRQDYNGILRVVANEQDNVGAEEHIPG